MRVIRPIANVTILRYVQYSKTAVEGKIKIVKLQVIGSGKITVDELLHKRSLIASSAKSDLIGKIGLIEIEF